MARDSVRQCRTATEFERVVAQQGGKIHHGGRHDLVYLDGRGPVAIPRHRGDLATGTRCSIIKALLQLGFFILLMLCLCTTYMAVVIAMP